MCYVPLSFVQEFCPPRRIGGAPETDDYFPTASDMTTRGLSCKMNISEGLRAVAPPKAECNVNWVMCKPRADTMAGGVNHQRRNFSTKQNKKKLASVGEKKKVYSYKTSTALTRKLSLSPGCVRSNNRRDVRSRCAFSEAGGLFFVRHRHVGDATLTRSARTCTEHTKEDRL